MGDGGAAVGTGAVVHAGDGDGLCRIPVGSGKPQGRRHGGHAGIAAGGGDGDGARGLGVQYDGVGSGITAAAGFGDGDTAFRYGDAGGIVVVIAHF